MHKTIQKGWVELSTLVTLGVVDVENCSCLHPDHHAGITEESVCQ